MQPRHVSPRPAHREKVKLFKGEKGCSYSVVDLNEGVVDGDNVDTTVVDAVEQLERLSHAMWGRGATHALRKT